MRIKCAGSTQSMGRGFVSSEGVLLPARRARLKVGRRGPKSKLASEGMFLAATVLGELGQRFERLERLVW